MIIWFYLTKKINEYPYHYKVIDINGWFFETPKKALLSRLSSKELLPIIYLERYFQKNQS